MMVKDYRVPWLKVVILDSDEGAWLKIYSLRMLVFQLSNSILAMSRFLISLWLLLMTGIDNQRLQGTVVKIRLSGQRRRSVIQIPQEGT